LWRVIGTRVSWDDTVTLDAWGTVADIASRYRIKMVDLTTGAVSDIAGSWAQTGSFTDDVNIPGSFYIGGEKDGMYFEGQITHVTISTLRTSTLLPIDAEINEVSIDPMNWMTTYKEGELFRLPKGLVDHGSLWTLNELESARSTHVHLMGDGTSDAFPVIVNQANQAVTGEIAMDMINMLASDIINVTVS